MTLSLYVPAATPLHRLHPVTKLMGFLALVVAAFLVERATWLAPLGVLVLVLLAVAQGLPTVRRLRLMFVLITVFTVVVWTFFYGGALAPSRAGFTYGVATALRLATFLAIGLLFLTTTRVEELAYALGRLGVPYTVGFTLTLSVRLVPVFFDSALTIIQAERCRGLDVGRGGPVARLRRFAPVIVPVFVGALRRADRMAMALELRGFNSGRPRTTYLRARAGWRDVVATAAAAGLVAGYVAVWASGLGSLPR